MLFQLESSVAELIMEIGYGFCTSVDICRNHLMSLSNLELTPCTVARIIAMMVRTHTGLDNSFWAGNTDPTANKDKPNDTQHPTTWVVEVFVQTLKELVRLFLIFKILKVWKHAISSV